MVSLINVLDASLALNEFLNIEMVKILLLILSIKIYAQWTEQKILEFFINFKQTFQVANNFFQMIYEVTKFNPRDIPKDLPEMIRPGLFVNMQIHDNNRDSAAEQLKNLSEKETQFANKELLCDYIYEIIHQFRLKNIRQKNNISLIINII